MKRFSDAKGCEGCNRRKVATPRPRGFAAGGPTNQAHIRSAWPAAAVRIRRRLRKFMS